MRRATLGWMLGLLLAGAPAGATTVVAYDLDDLTVRSDRVLTGTVVDLEARWEGNVVVTHVYVAVEECLKGPCGEQVVEVRVLGGRVDDLEMRVEGMARFVPDERVLLFLESTDDAGSGVGRNASHLRPTGLAQGKFRLVEGAVEPVALRDLEGLHLVGRRAADARALTLADLRALVAHIDAALLP